MPRSTGKRKPTLLITPGDPDGIGPEVVIKTLDDPKIRELANFVLIGAFAPFQSWSKKSSFPFIAAPKPMSKRYHLGGFQSGWAIESAVSLLLSKRADALVTGPISKENLNLGGYHFDGHTEFLASLCGKKSVTMMLCNSILRVSLVTTHIALGKVSKTITEKKISRAFKHTYEMLSQDCKIKQPEIAFLALNPHAGECGLFGTEESKIIRPTLKNLTNKYRSRARISGPHPADTFFAMYLAAKPKDRADAVIALYHDQGLIPVKMLDFQNTVNVTLGLPIVRTSVDHGVGFDIAGKGLADPSSLKAAIRLAVEMAKQRVNS